MILQLRKINEDARYLSAHELRKVISQCERKIAEGLAEMDDYETFVLCQQELTRRRWPHKLNRYT